MRVIEIGGQKVRVAPLRWTEAGQRFWEMWRRVPEPGSDAPAVSDEEWIDVVIPALRECLSGAGYSPAEVDGILCFYSPFDTVLTWQVCAAMRGK